jgi:hypothetical protein
MPEMFEPVAMPDDQNFGRYPVIPRRGFKWMRKKTTKKWEKK